MGSIIVEVNGDKDLITMETNLEERRRGDSQSYYLTIFNIWLSVLLLLYQIIIICNYYSYYKCIATKITLAKIGVMTRDKI